MMMQQFKRIGQFIVGNRLMKIVFDCVENLATIKIVKKAVSEQGNVIVAVVLHVVYMSFGTV